MNEELERGWGVRLTNRTGVNTGEVVAGNPIEGQRLVTGDAVNVAARLEQAAGANEVLLGDSTYRLVRDAVEVEQVEPLELKGKSQRVPAYRLIGVSQVARAAAPGAPRPLVGREAELAALCNALDDSVDSRAPRLVSLVAEAGVGKSRLVDELVRTLEGDTWVFRGRCLPYGRGITYWPIREMLRESARIADDDSPAVAVAKLVEVAGADVAARLAAAVGLTDDQYPVNEVSWAVRKLFETLGATRPIVFVVEDLHWAEQTLLDLLEQLVASADASLLLVAATRPTLFDHRPQWGAHERGRRVELAALSAGQSRAVVANLIGDARISDALRDRIVDAAEGNPLYVEQLLAYTLEEGGGGARQDPADDPGAARGAPRPVDARRAERRRVCGRRRPSLHGRGGASARARTPQRLTVRRARVAGSEAADRERPEHRGDDAPVCARTDPRRRLRGFAEAHPRGLARALRRLGRGRQPRSRSRDGVRGDPRLPPRAGARLPRGARSARRPWARARRPRSRATRVCRPASVRSRRHARRRESPAPCGVGARAQRARAAGAPAGTRRGADGVGRVRVGRGVPRRGCRGCDRAGRRSA